MTDGVGTGSTGHLGASEGGTQQSPQVGLLSTTNTEGTLSPRLPTGPNQLAPRISSLTQVAEVDGKSPDFTDDDM